MRAALGLAATDVEGPTYTSISTDTRTLAEGALFVALRGERFDGHAHVGAAADAGAWGAVVETSAGVTAPLEGFHLYPVADTLVALGDLAHYRRRALDPTVVAITGSSGKTTTKNLMAGALGSTYRTHATAGNLNNRVGVPLTVLAAPEDTQVLVLEMGTNEPGEIATLAGIGAPDLGVVTTVSETHLEGLGSLDGVLEEKVALVEALPESGTAFVGDRPPILADRARKSGRTIRVAGTSDLADASLRPTDPAMDDQGCYRFRWRDADVALRIPGEGAMTDALLALGVAEALDVDPARAADGVSAVEPGTMRGEIRDVAGRTVIVDCYNANPESVRSALRTLTAFPARGRRVAALGSMLELGAHSRPLHDAVLSEALATELDALILLGDFADAAGDHSDPRVLRVETPEEAGRALVDATDAGDVVLLKASRGVRLEGALPVLEEAD